MTAPPDLDALDALHEAAEPGPWRMEADTGCVMIGGHQIAGVHDHDWRSRPNAALIVALHNAYPALAAELRRARKIEAAARLQHDRMRDLLRDWPLSDLGSPQWCRTMSDVMREVTETLCAALDALDESGAGA